MKKCLFIIAILTASLAIFSGESFAQTTITQTAPAVDKVISPDVAPSYQPDTFLGQNQSYSVVFRGNGEAIVSLRVSLGNSGENPLKELTLRVPKVQATGIYVFQIFKEKQCIRYVQPVYNPQTGRYPVEDCAEYQEPNYYNDYYFYNAKYKKADYEYKNDTLTITLPSPIDSNKSGAVFIYFRATGYAKKDFWGAYNYTFVTLQSEESINSLNIGLSTDSDLYMKGVRGDVNYRLNDVAPTVAKLGIGGETGVANSALDSYLNQIGSGQIYKSVSNLMPLESYEVNGSYAKSRGSLYGKEILIGVISLLVIVALVTVSVVIIYRILVKGTVSLKRNEKLDVEEKQTSSTSNGKMFALVTLIGFIVSLLMTLYTILVFILGSAITKSIDYSLQSLFSIVLVIISILIYLLMVSIPGVLIGLKKSVGWGLATVVSIVLWLIFWVIIIFLILFLFGKSGGLYQILGFGTPIPIAY